jgi:hypothetical protein
VSHGRGWGGFPGRRWREGGGGREAGRVDDSGGKHERVNANKFTGHNPLAIEEWRREGGRPHVSFASEPPLVNMIFSTGNGMNSLSRAASS